MITWMQKHKKYLVVTIWISTIAFVGAGMVGWGAYDFNKSRATSVARVGDIDVSMQKFQSAYNKILDYYAQASGRELTQEEINRFNLSSVVIQGLVQEALLLNYAKELGLNVNNEEVINKLVSIPEFQINGVFNKEQYNNILRNLRTNHTNFEAELKDRLLLEKLFDSISLKSDEIGVEMIGADMFMQDKIRAKILSAKISQPTEEEIKESWGKSKDLYLTNLTYEFNSYFIPTDTKELKDEELQAFYEENRLDYKDDEGKILDFEAAKKVVSDNLALKKTKKTALEEYVKIKKGEKDLNQTLQVSADDTKGLDIGEFKNVKVGEILKPMEYENGFIILKVENIINPKPKTYEQAKEDVKNALVNSKRRQNLEQQAKTELETKKDFNKIAQFTKDDDFKILDLDAQNSKLLIEKVFNSNTKDGYIIFNDKAVVYEIIEQNLLDKNKLATFGVLLGSEATNMKNTQVENGLLNSLSKRYKVQVYYR